MARLMIGVLLLFFLSVMFTAALLIFSKRGKKGEVVRAEAGGT